MKKLTSLFLALAMSMSLAPTNIFAAESENIGRYNSLELPVVNEISSENTEEDVSVSKAMFTSESDSTVSNTRTITFEDEYYPISSSRQYTTIHLIGDSAEKVPQNESCNNYTLSFNFKMLHTL